MTLVDNVKAFFEKQAFGVCAWLGEKLSIPSADIRKFFIYTSFLAIGSPVIVYLILAFLLKLKNYFKSGKSSVWD
ncbi:MAG: PspC family transcriptional regulator [Bacteroidia bacterium]|nr:PspC family transcriptional regulator [Bacteroidia bacterium]